MEMRQMEYFVAVAEELHFSRAAERLHIAEQPLGYQIRKLEGELGFRLLDRTTRSVSLTPAGASFLEDARRIISQSERAADSAGRIAAGEAGVVRLGYEVSTVPSAMPDFVRLFRVDYPEIDLVLIERNRNGLISLAEEETDACLVTRYERLPRAFDYIPIRSDQAVVALPVSHPLAENDTVRITDLLDERLLGYTGLGSEPANRFIAALALNAGVDLSITQGAESPLTLLGLVAAGMGVAIVTAGMRTVFPESVAYRPLVDPEVMVDHGLVLRIGKAPSTAKALLAVAESLKDPGVSFD